MFAPLRTLEGGVSAHHAAATEDANYCYFASGRKPSLRSALLFSSARDRDSRKSTSGGGTRSAGARAALMPTGALIGTSAPANYAARFSPALALIIAAP